MFRESKVCASEVAVGGVPSHGQIGALNTIFHCFQVLSKERLLTQGLAADSTPTETPPAPPYNFADVF